MQERYVSKKIWSWNLIRRGIIAHKVEIGEETTFNVKPSRLRRIFKGEGKMVVMGQSTLEAALVELSYQEAFDQFRRRQ